MKTKHDDFRSIKSATFMLPPSADPARVGLIAAGNPDVLREAHGLEPYAKKRKRGGRVPITGAHAQHRLGRRSRRKFAAGGDADDADSQQPAQAPPPTAAPSSWLPSKYRAIGQGADAINPGAE